MAFARRIRALWERLAFPLAFTSLVMAFVIGQIAAEPDYETFSDRLELHGLDLRHVPSVERFAADLADRLDRLDVLVNNAAQTVRRPPAFYEHLLEALVTDENA